MHCVSVWLCGNQANQQIGRKTNVMGKFVKLWISTIKSCKCIDITYLYVYVKPAAWASFCFLLSKN